MDYNPVRKRQTIYQLLNPLWGLMENRIFTCSESAPCKLLTNYERKTSNSTAEKSLIKINITKKGQT